MEFKLNNVKLNVITENGIINRNDCHLKLYVNNLNEKILIFSSIFDN